MLSRTSPRVLIVICIFRVRKEAGSFGCRSLSEGRAASHRRQQGRAGQWHCNRDKSAASARASVREKRRSRSHAQGRAGYASQGENASLWSRSDPVRGQGKKLVRSFFDPRPRMGWPSLSDRLLYSISRPGRRGMGKMGKADGSHPRSPTTRRPMQLSVSGYSATATSTRLSKKVAPPPRSVKRLLVVVLQLT